MGDFFLQATTQKEGVLGHHLLHPSTRRVFVSASSVTETQLGDLPALALAANALHTLPLPSRYAPYLDSSF